MRPGRLTLEAFGPFLDRQEVDFSRLTGSELVLIEGPTGAGKTSIFDGISYALYGDVPGARSSLSSDLRSIHAADDQETRVGLEFFVHGKVYRVERKPAQPRKKRRGVGHTIQPAEAKLYAVEEEGERLLASKAAEVDDRVRDLVGLDAAQFNQVLVLPQGEFRRFLLAGSDEREKLLGRLFGDTIYRRVTDLLIAEARDIEEKLGVVDGHLKRRLEAAGFANEDGIDMAVEGMTAALPYLADELETRDAKLERAREEYAVLRELAQHHERLEKVRAEQQDLATRTEVMAALRRRLVDADRVAPFESSFATFHDARDLHHRAHEALEAAVVTSSGAERAATAAEEAAASLDDQRERLAGLQRKVAAVVELATEGEALTVSAREIGREEATLEAAQEERRTIAATLIALQAEGDELAAARSAGEQAAIRQGILAERLPRLRDGLVAVEDASSCLATVERARAREKTVREDRDVARKRLEDLSEQLSRRRRARESMLAAELARELEAGKPCPVCGATEHPDSARTADGDLAEVEVIGLEAEQVACQASCDELGASFAAAARDHETAGQALTEAQARLEEAVSSFIANDAEALAEGTIGDSEAGSGPSPKPTKGSGTTITAARAAATMSPQALADFSTRLRAWIVACQTALEVAKSSVAAAERARQREEDHHQATKSAVAKLAAIDATVTAQQAVLTERRTQLAERRRLLAAKLEGTDSVATFQQAVTGQRDALQQRIAEIESTLRAAREAKVAADASVVERRVQVEGASVRLQALQSDLSERATAAGFASLEAVAALILPEAERVELRKTLDEHDRKVAALVERAASLQETIADRAIPDMATARAAGEAAKAAREAAHAAHDSAQSRIDQARKLRAEVAKTRDEADELARTLRIAEPLARAARGHNPRKMPLARYVLAAHMVEVTHAASERLLRMSDGRYLLKLAEARGGRGFGGLDLVVEDRFAGERERPVQTLSGGEMFLASLSLAVGLADVVQAHAGGRRLEALFVDEGFGALDDESLDLAVRTLLDLRSQGRLVGLISHVEGLKERIPTKIRVRKGPAGSTVTLP